MATCPGCKKEYTTPVSGDHTQCNLTYKHTAGWECHFDLAKGKWHCPFTPCTTSGFADTRSVARHIKNKHGDQSIPAAAGASDSLLEKGLFTTAESQLTSAGHVSSSAPANLQTLLDQTADKLEVKLSSHIGNLKTEIKSEVGDMLSQFKTEFIAELKDILQSQFSPLPSAPLQPPPAPCQPPPSAPPFIPPLSRPATPSPLPSSPF
ncbi:hypothetical protein K474DRAFT_1665095 [Panus rudis PR-1116 ss-1]|nr:hypothetical protein K474DRAFT_1665095 [Panus rudis PR-1116 ss-1]